MTYRLIWGKKTKKDLRNIDYKERVKIVQKSNEILSNNPYIGSCLVGYDGLRRLRIGNYRVVYSIYEETITVRVVKIGHRKEIYNL